MAKLARASHPIRNLVIAFALMSSGTAAALAQDATTTTPPELRDFRLDPPPAEREPPPESTPPTVPPPSPSPQPTPQRPTPRPVVVPPSDANTPRPPGNSATTAPRAESRAPAETQLAPETFPEPANPTPPMLPPEPAQAEPQQAPSTSKDGIARIAGFAVLLVLTIAGGIYGYRRHNKATKTPAEAAVQRAAISRTNARPHKVATKQAGRLPTPTAPPAAAPTLTPKPEAKPRHSSLSMGFVPDKAVVSLANLMVRGQLQIANEGPDIIHGLELRAALIAASAQQQRAIESFFADPRKIQPSSAGTLNPGERIGLTLELSVALNEMQTFMLGDQTLLVPILLAVLSYENAAPDQVAQLVCMIGREASTPTAKMGPLRLDFGPRTYGQLGQRPLPA